jgi:hypothetical protein
MVREKRKYFILNHRFIFLAIYLIKRTLRNRQRHGLEEHEMVSLDILLNNLEIFFCFSEHWMI